MNDKLIEKLGDRVAAVSSELKIFSTKVSTAPTTLKEEVSDVPGASTTLLRSMAPELSASSTLVPTLLPQLNRADYKYVKRWDSNVYLSDRKGKTRRGEEPPAEKQNYSVLSSFMEDENGDQVPEKKKKAARAVAKGFFEELLTGKTAPVVWGSAPLSARYHLISILESQFPFLRLCEDHWKANMVATNSYSQWYPTAMAREATKKRAAKGDIIDVDANENDGENASESPMVEGENVSRPSKRPRIDSDLQSTRPHPRPRPRPLPRPTKFVPPRNKVCALVYIDYLHH